MKKNRVQIIKDNKLMLLFMAMIFLHGGYFYYESMIFGLISSILFFVYLQRNKSQRNGMDIAKKDQVSGLEKWNETENQKSSNLISRGQFFLPFLYLLFYMLPIINADSMHIYGIFKMIVPIYFVSILCLFWQPIQLLDQAFKAYIILLIIALIICIISYIFTGIGIKTEIFHYYPMIINHRFTGFFQYANVNAILSLLAGFYGIYIWKKGWVAVIAGLSLGLSGSRTAWILAFGLLIIAFVGEYIYRKKQNNYLSTNQYMQKSFIFSMVVLNAFFVLAIILGGFLLHQGVGENRLSQGLNASEFQTRLLYYKDGLQMIMQNPLGYGHYGYYLIQRQFQTGSTYFVKYIHSFLLQIIIDGGIISGVLFLIIIIKTTYHLLYRWICYKSYQAYFMGLIYGTLLFHSLLDFNFEFSYILIIFWIIYFYALNYRNNNIKIQNIQGMTEKDIASRKKIINISFKTAAIILGIIFINFGIISGLTYFGKPQLAAALGFTDAKKDILFSEEFETNKKQEIAMSMINNSIKNLETFAFLRNYYYNRGKLKEAIHYGRIAIKLAPLWIEHRRELMRIEYAYALNHPNDLKYVAEDIIEMSQKLKDLKKQKETTLNVMHKPQWEMTEEMQKWYLHFNKLHQN